jgi:uncharacterized membrane protein YuzA (DUF378 family)
MDMKKLNSMDWIALILIIIGGLNWGLVGLFSYNLVDSIFGAASALSRIVYVLVGIAAIYLIAIGGKFQKRSAA